MPVQDDAREFQMVNLFNLSVPVDRKRSDIDARLVLDGHELEFELKSTTTDTVSTVRDMGMDHIKKWRDGLHWLFAFYEKDGKTLRHCIYASPRDMEPWIADKEAYIRPDLVIAQHMPPKITEDMTVEILGEKDVYPYKDARLVMKNQWGTERYKEFMDAADGYSLGRMTEIVRLRARYVIERGSTLNNPHIGKGFFRRFEKITNEHASTLREEVRAYLDESASATD